MFEMKAPVMAGIVGAAVALGGAAAAETRVTLKSASSTSSYYVMMVQLGEVILNQSDGQILPTVEESQGSVQNVAEAGRRPGAFLFTTPPNLISNALAGEAPFERGNYEEIRTLFPMPFVTVHLVVRGDSDIESVADLAGRSFIAGGTGTFCQGQVAAIFETLGVADEVTYAEMELSGASGALRNNQVDGFATCSAHPTPQLQELSATLPIRVLSFTEEERDAIIEANPGAGKVSIAAGTYTGIEGAIETMAVPVGAYATNMDEDTALAIVSAFWEQRDAMAETNPWWAGVSPDLVPQLGAPLHEGVVAFYEERGISMD
ncbi:TAXI family TRAP transporter solute-binding subunit [Pararhodobacter sp. SW119]|uniref:TAXI family TRAP transporter solute-binding subunit n=1 Tax=Pararhodobacter sp. SW119 TaxID=2780075 RepID=UPI001ADEED4D|nr:TAXI family TRAP transporter solute-binding subunit [Pararhodobacter sp. SW119]